MAIPAYSTLGISDKALVDTWSKSKPYLDPVATEMEGGNKRLRSLPGDEAFIIQFDILLTNAEFVTFENYVKVTLGNGCARFDMRVYDGQSYAVRTVQFEQSYSVVPQPPLKKQVTLMLRVYP